MISIGLKRKRTARPERIIPDENLPVRLRQDDILKQIATNDVLIIIAETGSGKTTQIPQLILENQKDSSILITQPRRVAAISVAKRVAEERGCALGEQVGYAVRFDDKSNREVTRIRYVTDGVMLREALSAGLTGLRNRYSHIVIDEIHERSVNTDIVLGIVKCLLMHDSTPSPAANSSTTGLSKLLMRSKLPFKIILMSATTDAEKLRRFFTHNSRLKVSMLNVEGKLYNVRTMYISNPANDYVEDAVTTVFSIMMEYRCGDILVFLPGQDDIQSAYVVFQRRRKELRQKNANIIQVFSLYSAMSSDEQLRALLPLPEEHRENGFKVIFATNIAETSVTIPGIRFVVDCGLMKVRRTGSGKDSRGDKLLLQSVSRAQADQRKGRAGRTGDGAVYRLYTEKEYNVNMKPYPIPEILRSEATGTMLQITALIHFFAKKMNETAGKNKEAIELDYNKTPVSNFPLLDVIPEKQMEFALESLFLLDAISKKNMMDAIGKNNMLKLTKTGELMSRLPVPPMLARALLESVRLGCVEAMCSVAAVLSVDGIIFQDARGAKKEKIMNAQKRFLNVNGDHLTSANALHGVWQLQSQQKQHDFCMDYFLHFKNVLSALSIRRQLIGILEHSDMTAWGINNKLPAELEVDLEEASMDELVRRCLVSGYFRNIAQKRDNGGYVPIMREINKSEQTGRGEEEPEEFRGDIHPSSVLLKMKKKREPEILLYNECISTSKVYFRTVSVVEKRWLAQHTSYFRIS